MSDLSGAAFPRASEVEWTDESFGRCPICETINYWTSLECRDCGHTLNNPIGDGVDG